MLCPNVALLAAERECSRSQGHGTARFMDRDCGYGLCPLDARLAAISITLDLEMTADETPGSSAFSGRGPIGHGQLLRDGPGEFPIRRQRL
jgi:hypothetical protein